MSTVFSAFKYVEVISAGGESDSRQCFGTWIESDECEIECSQVFEAVVAVPKVDVTGIRLESGIDAEGSSPEIAGLRHVERAQDQRIRNAEDHRIRSDCHGKRRDGHHSEARRFVETPKTEAHIATQGLDQISRGLFASFLLETRLPAEFPAGAPFCFGAIEPGAFQIVGSVLNVAQQLRVEIVFHPGAVKESLRSRSKIGEHR